MPRSRPVRASEVFAQQLRRFREEKRPRLTTDALAERLRKLGAPIHPTAITKIEKGGRKVTVDEWLLFAAALDVPPPLLLCPLGTEDRLEVTANSRIHPHLALDWLCGEERLPDTGRYASGDPVEWRRNAAPLLLFRQLRQQQNEVHRTRATMQRAEFASSKSVIQEARRNYMSALQDLAATLEEMAAREIRPPKLATEIVSDMSRLGIREG